VATTLNASVDVGELTRGLSGAAQPRRHHPGNNGDAARARRTSMLPATAHRQVVRVALVAVLVLVAAATSVQQVRASPMFAATQPGQVPTTSPITPSYPNLAPPVLSLAFDQKWMPTPTQTEWRYKVTNSGAATASNISYKYAYQDWTAGSPVLKSGTFIIGNQISGGGSQYVAFICYGPITACKDSTLEILPGNYQIASGAGKASAP
jgi:hypothetical protein